MLSEFIISFGSENLVAVSEANTVILVNFKQSKGLILDYKIIVNY